MKKLIEGEEILNELYGLIEKYSDGYDVQLKEVVKTIEMKHKENTVRWIPVSIFNSKLGILEAVVKYLRENCGLRFVEIGFWLERNPKSIWISYRNAKLKFSGKLSADHHVKIPIMIFSQEKAPLEALVAYLREHLKLKYSEIAKMLERDNRVVWATYKHAKK